MPVALIRTDSTLGRRHPPLDYAHLTYGSQDISLNMDNIPLFEGLDRQDLDLIAALIRYETFSAGETIFAQDATAEKLYILLSGKIEIRFKPHDGEQLLVCEIGEGGIFGWSAALGRDSYTSCAVCTANGKAASIKGSELRTLLASHPQTGVVILERLADVIAQRLRSTHEQVVALLRQGMQH
jgi:CRP-like cAMP-binding protein